MNLSSQPLLLTSVILGIAAFQGFAAPTPATAYWVYVGTYTDQGSQGIYVSKLDVKTGTLSTPVLAATTKNPTFLAVHPNQTALFAANEIGDFKGKRAGAVSGYTINPKTGLLTLINQESAGGDGTCHLVLDAKGKHVLCANYGGGSVTVLPLDASLKLLPSTAFIQHQGSSANPDRQKEPHAHSINLSRNNRFAYAADLGIDKILIYKFDPTKGTLVPNDPPSASLKEGAGPRHLTFNPGGNFAYVINELDSTLTGFSYDRNNGSLTEFQTLSTLPADFTGSNSTAEVQAHPSGQYLYGSNRGHHSIAVFSVDPFSGQLTLVEHQSTQGKTPRNFSIDPQGQFLLAANQDSSNIIAFKINPDTGKLTPTGQKLEVSRPVCIKFVPID